jgi:hypothetical protein
MASGITQQTTTTLRHHLTAIAESDNDKAADGYMLLNVAADLKRKGLGFGRAAKFAVFCCLTCGPACACWTVDVAPAPSHLAFAGVVPGEAVGIDFDPDSVKIARVGSRAAD